MKWYLIAFKKYFDFKGRSTRSEYLFFVLFYTLGTIFWAAAATFLGTTHTKAIFMALLGLYMMIHIIPSLSLIVRRLHDINKSAWWILISFIPFIGPITMFIFTLIDSKEDNKYGVNPKLNLED